MSELTDLYQEVILDHGRRPRNFGPLEGATHEAEGYNPLCGDRFHVHLRVEGDTIREARFEGSGCAISTASASLMTEALKGARVDDFPKMFDGMHDLVTGKPGDEDALGKLVVFNGVAAFPMRVKCAILAWHTGKAAIEGEAEVSTE